MIVDVHSHIYFPEFENDLNEVIERAKEAGIISIISAGIDHKTNMQVLELAKKDKILNSTLGIYPTTAMNISEKELDDEIRFIKENNNEIIGIGEIGLDFKEANTEEQHKKQINAFRKILTSLESLDKPFIIHSRKAEKECISILEELNIKKVNFHCFTGSYKLAKKIEQNGWFLSIPANIDKSEHFQGIVNLISINNLLTETDAPYLCPKGKERSEPSFITGTIDKISEIKKLDVNEVKKNIFLNYQKLFYN
ncbi:MAG: TatD family hydrolase [Nanoarchaeota archaeon]|nr:TatD family hydrolase [Nanoarchaeota archaeon]